MRRPSPVLSLSVVAAIVVGCSVDLAGTGAPEGVPAEGTSIDGTTPLPSAGPSDAGDSPGATPSDEGDAAASSGDGGADAKAPQCPTGRGPAMVRVPSGSCIDATEVTNDQYLAFFQSPAAEPAEVRKVVGCAWVTTVRPSEWSPGGGVPYAAADSKAPVVGVDWCDAFAFCKWAGKRLCGKRGGDATPAASRLDPAVSQWFDACSAGGARAWPYGAAEREDACTTRKPGAPVVTRASDVASKATCQGGYPGLFDMSGNVGEWEDSCVGTAGRGDRCPMRGGSFRDAPQSARCDSIVLVRRDEQDRTLGFRCCAE